MKAIAALFVLASALSAHAQTKPNYAALVETGVDENGVRVASSMKAADIKRTQGYSPGASTKIYIFWLEARKPENGPAQVLLTGQRVSYMLPKEAPKEREFGPSDPADPAYVGNPWTEADLRYRGANIQCISDVYYCSLVYDIEIVLPDAVIRGMLAKPSMKDLPVALSGRRKVDWRVPREELVATLDKLGVLAEFSAQ